ncbi:hypothetical protein GQ53DRAFT_768024 [Thozetella sp. PMI_491]|nr:hypothetical protein GQ53DRAFT_768024 [Thozetella sp. PMI_491]
MFGALRTIALHLALLVSTPYLTVASPTPETILQTRATTLTHRAETGISAIDGTWVAWQPGYPTGTYLLFHNTDYVTLKGTGYVLLRWEVEYWQRAGVTTDVSITTTGTFKLVAGGGGMQHADHPAPFCNDPSGVCYNATGGTTYGYTWFTNLANHWHNEYYWLDGQVTLQTREGTGLYNVGVNITTYNQMLSEINTVYASPYRIGVSFDPKSGTCPCAA